MNASAKALLSWYGKWGRRLPWRETKDPYAIWISEIMLQQTQVSAVLPRYASFLRRFPTVEALAEAPLDDLLKAWQGLGYYARAHNLHAAAKRCLAQFDGQLPSTVQDLRSLPGIGPSTAGAIASIAFGGAEPILDGNVIRVLCRLHRIRSDPKTLKTRRRLWRLAAASLPGKEPGPFNQALMDLGAMVCTPRQPQCNACPLGRFCLAHRLGEACDLPKKGPRNPIPHRDIGVAIIRWRNRYLICRRRPEGLLAGLWEFPGGKRESGETLEECVAREIHEEVGLDVRVVAPFLTVKHAYTHFRVTLHVFECKRISGKARPIACSACRWIPLESFEAYAFPAANQRIIAWLRQRS